MQSKLLGIVSGDFDVADEVVKYILNLPHSFIHSLLCPVTYPLPL